MVSEFQLLVSTPLVEETTFCTITALFLNDFALRLSASLPCPMSMALRLWNSKRLAMKSGFGEK